MSIDASCTEGQGIFDLTQAADATPVVAAIHAHPTSPRGSAARCPCDHSPFSTPRTRARSESSMPSEPKSFEFPEAEVQKHGDVIGRYLAHRIEAALEKRSSERDELIVCGLALEPESGTSPM